MGYPIQTGAPQCTLNGVTYAVGAFEFPNPIGTFFKIGAYQNDPVQGWVEIYTVANYTNSGDLLADIQAKGGAVKFIHWLINQINDFFQTLFGAPPVTTEPTTDAEAKNYVTNAVNGLSLVVVNGIPVLK